MGIIKSHESNSTPVGFQITETLGKTLFHDAPGEQNIGTELDKRRGIILNAINQIAEQYEWFLTQDYERDGEIVSDIYRDAIKRCLADNRKLYGHMDDFDIVSSTGIISVNLKGDAA